jgi:hypothetical protein
LFHDASYSSPGSFTGDETGFFVFRTISSLFSLASIDPKIAQFYNRISRKFDEQLVDFVSSKVSGKRTALSLSFVAISDSHGEEH